MVNTSRGGLYYCAKMAATANQMDISVLSDNTDVFVFYSSIVLYKSLNLLI